jgi:hypothetical protein
MVLAEKGKAAGTLANAKGPKKPRETGTIKRAKK